MPILGIFVALIVCAAGAKTSSTDKYCALLGEVSYPLYLVPLAYSLHLHISSFDGDWPDRHIDRHAVSHWLCAPMIAYLVARNYEMPLRRLLTN